MDNQFAVAIDGFRHMLNWVDDRIDVAGPIAISLQRIVQVWSDPLPHAHCLEVRSIRHQHPLAYIKRTWSPPAYIKRMWSFYNVLCARTLSR